MKIQAHIESIFRYRLAENSDIASYIAKLDRMGRFDDKKKSELLVFLLTRVSKLEERLEVLESSKKPLKKPMVKPQDTSDLSSLKMAQIWKLAREKGIDIKGKKKDALILELTA